MIFNVYFNVTTEELLLAMCSYCPLSILQPIEVYRDGNSLVAVTRRDSGSGSQDTQSMEVVSIIHNQAIPNSNIYTAEY